METPLFSRVLNVELPNSEGDNARRRVVIGDAKENYLIGWIDEEGFYVRSSDGKLIRLSMIQLLSIGDHIDLIRLGRIEREMGR